MLTGLAKKLVDAKLLSLSALDRIQQHSQKAGKPFFTCLLENDAIDNSCVVNHAALEFGLPLMDLSGLNLDPEITALVPENLIREHAVLPLFIRRNALLVALSNPCALNVLNELKFHCGYEIEPVLIEHEQLQRAIEEALSPNTLELDEIADTELDALEVVELAAGDIDIEDAPVVRFVNKILLDAINREASDIHFEQFENHSRIRFRLDGMLRDIASPPKEIADRITSRIKVMARLDIAERRMPQDGRVKMKISRTHAVDFRVSTCPTLFGEKIVLRLLDTNTVNYDMSTLGLEPEQERLFLQAISRPHGMILVTGPTGSGKTVTMYAALNQLNSIERNISTAEDPAEIYLSGVNQVNINPKIGLSFASALRAFLRQDPDVIMIGEIRDTETANIAMKAAQTGHLVFSTLHTNDGPQTLNRLLNMGVNDYDVASSISLIIAQRLVRKLCPACKQASQIPKKILLSADLNTSQFTIYKPVGCQQCNQGYRGRAGIYQLMPVSTDMGKIILGGGNSMDLSRQAHKEGIADLRSIGLKLVINGTTSLDELNRVTIEA